MTPKGDHYCAATASPGRVFSLKLNAQRKAEHLAQRRRKAGEGRSVFVAVEIKW